MFNLPTQEEQQTLVATKSGKWFRRVEETVEQYKKRWFVKGTLARSGIRRQVPARRRFGNMYIRLGIRVMYLPPRSVFRGCRMVDANIRES